ncbi:Uncharacterised protein [Escherichia coli]|nr:Uncharacterised protein [Escherichia coli]
MFYIDNDSGVTVMPPYPPSVVLSFAGFQKVTGIMLSHGPAWTGLILCRRSY